LYATNNETRASATNKEYNELSERIQKTPAGAKKERIIALMDTPLLEDRSRAEN
jgi:hypothetical protein